MTATPRHSHFPARLRSTRALAAIGAAAVLAASLSGEALSRKRSGDSDTSKWDQLQSSRQAGPPVLAVVSLREQRVTIYDAEGRILRAPVSSGRPGYETPAGIYSVIQKEAEHYSNLYDDASMPFMQRITWSGIALHAGALPGHPASHGCIRLPYAFAEHLFGLTKLNMRVIVSTDDVAPAEIAHPALFKPETTTAEGSGEARLTLAATGADAPPAPAGARSLRALAAQRQAEADAAIKAAETARINALQVSRDQPRLARQARMAEAQRNKAEAQVRDAERRRQSATSAEAIERADKALEDARTKAAEARETAERARREADGSHDTIAVAREAARAAEAERVAAVAAAKEAQRKTAPVSVFISRETQRLYVRQSMQPLFDAPVTIADADKPMGTHVFTALAFTAGETALSWNVVTMPHYARSEPKQKRRAEVEVHPVAADPVTAAAALDRIQIPAETRTRIAELVSPGSSLIVSDEPLSKETGTNTDHIVLMSGVPQGGVKIRRRDPEQRYRSERYRSYQQQPSFFSFW